MISYTLALVLQGKIRLLFPPRRTRLQPQQSTRWRKMSRHVQHDHADRSFTRLNVIFSCAYDGFTVVVSWRPRTAWLAAREPDTIKTSLQSAAPLGAEKSIEQ